MTPPLIVLSNNPQKSPYTATLFNVKTVDRRPRKKIPAELQMALVHEVRNPLTNINLSLNILQTQVKDPEVKEYMEIIQRSSDRINKLVNDFLQVGSVSKKPLARLSIHRLVSEVLEITNDQLALKKINVHMDFTDEDHEIRLNGPEIKICLTNIIINAIDAMEAGAGHLKLQTRSSADHFFLHITDNGCGISAGNLSRIFTPYYTNKKGGMGLGLSTTYNLLCSNHVGIKVHSELGLGTRFSLLFDKKLQ